MNIFSNYLIKSKALFRYIKRFDFKALYQKIFYGKKIKSKRLILEKNYKNLKVGIIYSPELSTIAELIFNRLNYHGIKAEICCEEEILIKYKLIFSLGIKLKNSSKINNKTIYLFSDSKKEILFSNKDYKDIKKYYCILASSLSIIEKLSLNGINYPNVYYLPTSVSNKNSKITLNSVKSNYFNFMFDRLLIGIGVLPLSSIENLKYSRLINRNNIVISLPETIYRRKHYNLNKMRDYEIFDGLRAQEGWIGCALSYRFIAQQALQYGIKQLTIMEDDVVFSNDSRKKINIVKEFLKIYKDDWNIFVGIVTDVTSNIKILDYRKYKDIEFVTIDSFTGAVFNIYNHDALKYIANWDYRILDINVNSNDKYFGNNNNFKYITTLPYLVEHSEFEVSTLWGVNNTAYSKLIKESQVKLRELVDEYLENKNKVK